MNLTTIRWPNIIATLFVLLALAAAFFGLASRDFTYVLVAAAAIFAYMGRE